MFSAGLAAVGLLAVGCGSERRTLFVSPTGSDANSGTINHPYATLPQAMARVRELRRAGPNDGPITVFLRGGTYSLRAPIVFTPDDSGTEASPITYSSYRKEQVVLSGGAPLKGAWHQTPGKPYWQLDLSQRPAAERTFHALYVNGESRTRARTPNWGDKVLRAEGREPGGDPRQALRYYPGDVDPSWRNPTDIDVVLLCSWTPTIHRISAILPELRTLRFASSHSRAVDAWEPHFRYYLSNVFEALDQPGEWYLDRPTGQLYYYPPPGENVAESEVIIPVMKSKMIEFAGDLENGRFIEHLHFRGLSFRHLDGDMDRHNGSYRQGHMYLSSAITARGLRSASFERCELAHLGEYALELADGCRGVTVRQCHIWDLGAGAIQLGVTDLGTLLKPIGTNGAATACLESARAVSDLVIDNTCIHRLGTIWHGCYGIVNRFASRTQITHNEIYDTHWDAIGLDARWDWKGEQYSCGNVIAYNHLHHLGLRYQTDAAGVYQFGPLDTHIHHNLIHDTFAYPYICGFAGIYLDEQSRNARVENNLVFNTDWFAYFQHKGMDNLFNNNIGAFARDGLIGRGGLNAAWTSNYLEACHNIYISSNAVALKQDWQPGLKPPLLCSNLYHTLASDTELTFAGKPFAAWQAEGRDRDSVVADPGCRNPLAADFALAAGAPACTAIGFVPFDTDLRSAGLYGDSVWRSLPNQHPPRHPSATWSPDDLDKLVAFELDFNPMKDGDEPGVFRASEQKNAGFAVTSEIAGTRGPKCLRVTDKKGLPKSFYPYMHIAPRALKRGRISFSFDALLPKQAPAPVTVDFRGRNPGETGPALAFASNGEVKANGKSVCTLTPGVWTAFEIAFALGAKRTGSYELKVSTPSDTIHLALPFGSASFEDLSWLGITAPSDADGTFYLDWLRLSVSD